MRARQRDWPLAIDQTGKLGGRNGIQTLDCAIARHTHINAAGAQRKTATSRWPSNWWRRRDGCSTPFGAGRTMPSSRCRDAERVIRRCCCRILVRARPIAWLSASMSLYRAGLKLALFLPLGVAMPV